MNGPLKMLQVCAREYGWSHEEMLKMPKRLLFRYYGYWNIETILRNEEIEKENEKQARKERMDNPDTKWKSL